MRYQKSTTRNSSAILYQLRSLQSLMLNQGLTKMTHISRFHFSIGNSPQKKKHINDNGLKPILLRC